MVSKAEVDTNSRLLIIPSFCFCAHLHQAKAKAFTVLQTRRCLHGSTSDHHILSLLGTFWSHSILHSPDTRQRNLAQHPHTEDNRSQLKSFH